ncbi:hypothetical protein [Nesterenkonia sp. PF2B19]|uniref:hypothetical protein n=1 Tax=Nesterenkonia sp. PF2B19 TaxID=1881858 RepID=UPI000872552D|nr:hypothetical protein [Nesterenkonia sp. PF2B19]OSM43487.1 hypothetical protein BCY76_008185 [Nesterenkonia sp. PF2B19]
MNTFTITCSAGHPPRKVAVVVDFGGWACDPPEADMNLRRRPVHGYSFRCSCGAGAAAHKDDMHRVLTRLATEYGIDELSIQAIARARRWQGGFRRPEQLNERSPA